MNWKLLCVLSIFLMKNVEAINFGLRQRFHPTSETTTIAQESKQNNVLLKPYRNETLQERQLSLKNEGKRYTILYPLTFRHSRGGQFLNLTLPVEPSSTDQVEPRIVNHPDLYSYFEVSSQRQNKAANYGPSPTSKELKNEPETAFTNPPEEYFETKVQPLPDSTIIKDPRNVHQTQAENYKGTENLAVPYQKTGVPLLVSPLNPNSETSIPHQHQRGKTTPSRQGQNKNRVQYNLSHIRQNKTTTNHNFKVPSRYIKTTANIHLPQPVRYNKFKIQAPRESSQRSVFHNNDTAPLPIRNHKAYSYGPFPSRYDNVEVIDEGAFKTPQIYDEEIVYVPELPLEHIEGSNIGAVLPLPQYTRIKAYETCYCIPYYLCKNGAINSGGRSIAPLRRQARSTMRNRTFPSYEVQPKIMNSNPTESNPEPCEQNKVCCRISFAEEGYDYNDETDYPVATPAPDPEPPRIPDKNESEGCGVRRAYGVQGRLKQLQYSADVSEFGEYPWQIAVLKKVEGDKHLYLCGGVMISNKWVATAAHCIKKDKNSPLLIRLGEWDVNRKDEVYPYVEKDVDALIIHPDFNAENLQNDLALIRMQEPVDSRIPHVNPVCLPKYGQLFENQKCWVSGWGKDFFGPQGEYQNVLKEVDVPVVSKSICTNELRGTNLGPHFALHPGFLCAGGEAGKDACTGDGGSPLVCKSEGLWYVVGLVSWGIGCGQPGIPGVYVNVLYYVDWINSVIKS